MFLSFRAVAKVPLSREVKREGQIKAESVVGRNWWIWMVEEAFSRVFAGSERRTESFSCQGKDKEMFRAERSCANWVCASVGDLGCTPGPLDQMTACLMMDSEAGRRRS